MKKKSLFVLGIMVIFLFKVSAYASVDDLLPGEWYYQMASNLTIGVEVSASSIFDEINWARNQWNGINSNANFSSCLKTYAQDVQVGVVALNGLYGITYLYDINGNDNDYGIWRSGRIWIDESYGTIAYDFMKKICVHEFGHILGLKDLQNPPRSSIMKQGWHGFNIPQPYDKENINLKY